MCIRDSAVIRRIAAFAVPAPKREDPQPLFSMTLPYDLNILDVVLLSVIALFTLRGALRGFLDEVAGLVGILGGVWLAGRYYGCLLYTSRCV